MNIRVFTGFSGYDSQLLALKRLKKDFPSFDYECVGWSEIDKYAIQAHNALFPELADKNYGDICNIDWEKVPDFDLFTMSSPCFPEGTTVLTQEGYKDIKDLTQEDNVLTHANSFKPIVEVKKHEYKGELYHINSQFTLDLACTPEHPFYIRKIKRSKDKETGKYIQKLGEPEWILAKDLNKNCFLGYAINKKATFTKSVSKSSFLPSMIIKRFIENYAKNKGCDIKEFETIKNSNKETILTLAQCVAKAYHRPFSLKYDEKSKQYILKWSIEPKKKERAFYENGYLWFPIKEISSEQWEGTVYNLEVDDDHTYTANGCIVHNCQDFSAAGLQKGGEEGSGTRSSLLWQCRKAILAKKPKYIFFENVKGLTTKKFLPYFRKWQEELNSYGYTNFVQILNAKDYGVPQNRERVFMISILDFDGNYNFPKKMPLTRCLQDVLDDEVDEKYYISEKLVQDFLKKNSIANEKA